MSEYIEQVPDTVTNEELVRQEIAAGLRRLDEQGRLYYGAVLTTKELEAATCRPRTSSEFIDRIIKLKGQLIDRGMFVSSKGGNRQLTIIPYEEMPGVAIRRTRAEKKRRAKRLKGLAAVPKTLLTHEQAVQFERAEQKLAVMILQDNAVINKRTNFPVLGGTVKKNPYKD